MLNIQGIACITSAVDDETQNYYATLLAFEDGTTLDCEMKL